MRAWAREGVAWCASPNCPPPAAHRLYRKGRRRTADGTYVGEFINGQPTGKGRMDYVGGRSYLGEWEVRCRWPPPAPHRDFPRATRAACTTALGCSPTRTATTTGSRAAGGDMRCDCGSGSSPPAHGAITGFFARSRPRERAGRL